MENLYSNTYSNKKIPVVSLTRTGLSFNKHSIELLNSPAFISLELMFKELKLIVRPLSAPEKNFCCFTFVKPGKNRNRITIRNMQIIYATFPALGIYSLKNTLNFELKKENGIFIADLNNILFND